ncbi:MAG: hypothetical protein KME31_18805 [Tolypothrix carrinoi HA7290-LM1]|jgi:hypothetical protein|nr:hypothetical protein [Tolypothrix carrinoi HA7290-LM1]
MPAVLASLRPIINICIDPDEPLQVVFNDEQEVVRIVALRSDRFERQLEADEKKMLGFLASTQPVEVRSHWHF